MRGTTYQDEPMKDFRTNSNPSESLDNALNALFEIQRAEMHTRNSSFDREPVYHLDCEVHSEIFHLLVIVLR